MRLSKVITVTILLLTGSIQVWANEPQVLFYRGADNIPYRIPAIAKAKNGDLIAFTDFRYCHADIGNGHVDILARISKNNGGSWGEPQMIMDGTGEKNVIECGYGDAAVVADRNSNKILVIAAAGNKTYWASKADDPQNVVRSYGTYKKGKWHWSEPVDMTADFYTKLFNGKNDRLFFGSGNILQSRTVKTGKYYRLYAALCTGNGNFVVYSDNFGESWDILGSATESCIPKGDEPKCEELPNGNIVISSRKSYGRFFNIFTFTNAKKAQGSWGEAVESNKCPRGIAFGRNACNGEILFIPVVRNSDKERLTLALQSVPIGDAREKVSIFFKPLVSDQDYDTPTSFASNWEGKYLVTSEPSAYSTMCLQADNRIAFFYEEEPGNYSMVYAPLQLEKITSGLYSVASSK